MRDNNWGVGMDAFPRPAHVWTGPETTSNYTQHIPDARRRHAEASFVPVPADAPGKMRSMAYGLGIPIEQISDKDLYMKYWGEVDGLGRPLAYSPQHLKRELEEDLKKKGRR